MADVLRLTSREEWGASPSVYEEPASRNPITKVFFWYHAPLYGWFNNYYQDCRKIMREMQRRHTNDFGFSDVAWHFAVGRDGYVYEGRPLTVSSPRSFKFNPAFYGNRIDIVYLGDYLEEPPPYKMIKFGFLVTEHCVKLKKLHKLFTYTDIKQVLQPKDTSAS